ncbi:hypothetical protein JCM9803A_09970 [Rhodococcus erythropolis]
MTGVDVEHTKALEAAATPGPWVTTPPNSTSGWLGNYWSIGTEVDGLLERFAGDIGGALDNTQADAKFIAHARTAVPALVAAVERVQALHTPWPPPSLQTHCRTCAHPMPCPTRQALETP